MNVSYLAQLYAIQTKSPVINNGKDQVIIDLPLGCSKIALVTNIHRFK
ncbi:hypothetical protein [Leptospira neocaledonica]|nr:hypothetical protein [Leptospira neocaledonica]